MTSQNVDDYNRLSDQDKSKPQESKPEVYDLDKQGSPPNEKPKHKKCRWWLIAVGIAVAIVVVGIIVYFLVVNVHNNNNSNNNDNNNDNSKASTNKYYVVVNKSLNYFDANEYCSSMYGTSLTTIFDMYQNNIAQDLCTWSNNNANNNNNNSNTSGNGCWIGYTKSDTLLDNSEYIVESVNGKGWFWLWYNTTNSKIDWTSLVGNFTLNDTNSGDDDKSTLINNFKNWNGDYQTIEQDTECAILLSKNGTWLSQACNKRYPFVCNYYLEVECFYI